MALLTSPDILPEAMRFLVRAILALSNDVDRDELIELVAPAGLVEAIKSLGSDAETVPEEETDLKKGGAVIADRSLAALAAVGIVRITKTRVSLAAVPEKWRDPNDVDSLSFAQHLRNRVFASADRDIPVGDSGEVMDLVHGLGVLYQGDTPLQPFSTFEPDRSGRGRSFMEHQRSMLGEDRSDWPVPNREQWIPLRRWATYIGLASFGPCGLIADASVALIQGLRELPSAQYGIEQFVAECAQRVPILDGGSLQIPYKTGDSSRALLSPGLSNSILQLEAERRLALSKLSDVGTRTLRTGSDNGADRPISHVKWINESSRKADR